MYIGQSHCVCRRVIQHDEEQLMQFNRFSATAVPAGGEEMRLRIECALIRRLYPFYNLKGKWRVVRSANQIREISLC